MPPTERTFSPRELADALGVSESSMKRWIDAGEVVATRTAGGHRRVAFREAIRFIRRRQMHVVNPAAIGLGDLTHIPPDLAAATVTADLLVEVLNSGRAAVARRLLVAAYLRGDALPALCDGPVRDALHRIGEWWKAGRRGILVEHRATDLLLQSFHQIRSFLPPPPPGAPVAVGGALSGDPYVLPSLMAATVLADLGFAVTNLGADTPVPVLADAARSGGAGLVWLSVSVCPSDDVLAAAVSRLAEALQQAEVQVVVGGRRTQGVALPVQPRLAVRDSMRALAEVAHHRGTNPVRRENA